MRLALTVILATAIPLLASSQPDPAEALVDHALRQNPDLSAIDHRITALTQQAEAVRRWMDPVISIEYSNFPIDSWALGDSPMTGLQIRLQQTLTLGGKNDRRQATVMAQSDAMRWMLAERRNQLAAQVRQGFWTLALIRRLRGITENHIALVGQLHEAVQAKYQVGKVGQQDLIRLDVLRDKLRDDLEDFTRRDTELLAALNGALHREPQTAIDTPEDFVAIAPPEISLDDWLARAQAQRPLLKVVATQARAKRLAADQAAYERWPDVSIWAAYRIRQPAGADDGTDQMSVGLSLPLPFDYTGHARAQQEANLSEAAALDADAAAALDGIKAEIAATLAAWQRAGKQADTYRETLIPGARRGLESALAAYQSDRSGFASLFEAELQVLDFERTQLAAAVATHIQKARLEAAVGIAAETSANGTPNETP